MLKGNEILYISPNFKNILTRGNKYEDYVLDLMNLSNSVFPGNYEKVEKQSNGEPDFLDKKTGDKYDVKLVASEYQCQRLCGHDDIPEFIKEISKQNNEIYNSIINNDTTYGELLDLMKVQATKNSTQNKNLIFFFTFPIGAHFSNSITGYLLPNLLTFLLSNLKDVAGKREIFAICPTVDGCYELRKMSNPSSPEFVPYTRLDKFFKWTVTTM